MEIVITLEIKNKKFLISYVPMESNKCVCVCVRARARARVCVCMQGKYLRQRDFHNFSAIFPTLTYILFNIQLRNYYDRRPNDIPLF